MYVIYRGFLCRFCTARKSCRARCLSIWSTHLQAPNYLLLQQKQLVLVDQLAITTFLETAKSKISGMKDDIAKCHTHFLYLHDIQPYPLLDWCRVYYNEIPNILMSNIQEIYKSKIAVTIPSDIRTFCFLTVIWCFNSISCGYFRAA